MSKYIERKAAYRFCKEQLEKETGAFSKGWNAGLKVAMAAVMNKDAIHAADVRHVVNDCYKCPYKQICHDLPIDMSCEDVLNYARWRKADV